MKEMILSEEELVRRCVGNDRRAQEFLFDRFYSDLYAIAMRYLSDHHDAEDVVIQSFTRTFKYLRKFTYGGPGSLGRWIRTILINEAVRSLKKRNLFDFNKEAKQLEVPFSEADGLQQMQAGDILNLIEKLPLGYRTVFNLFAIEGFSHKEIAEKLGISESTSKTQLKKARNQLMISLKEHRNYGTV